MQLTAVQHHISNYCTYHQLNFCRVSHPHVALSQLFREICNICLELFFGTLTLLYLAMGASQGPGEKF